MPPRSTRLALGAAAVAFVVYPAVRPYGPESGAEGALDLGSPLWLLAHVSGVVGFVLIAVALRIAAPAPPWPWVGPPVRRVESWAWAAVALLLPYYGAEGFGLWAVAQYATQVGDPGVLATVDTFRYGVVPLTSFGLGLLALAVVGVLTARGLWRSGTPGRIGGLLVGAGLVTYLPQFFVAPGVRIAHGVVLAVGLVLVAVAAGPSATSPGDGGTPRSGAASGEPARGA